MNSNSSATPSPSIPVDGTIADAIIAYPVLRPLFEKFGFDYCCGGKQPFREAVKESGLTLEKVLEDCYRQIAEAKPSAGVDNSSRDWSTSSLTDLANHIETTHHVYTRGALERIDQLLAKVQRAHSGAHGAMLDAARRHFNAVRDELSAHMPKEESILFPAMRALEAYLSGAADKPQFPFGTIAKPIEQMVAEHEEAGDALAELRKATQGYELPQDSCPTFEAMYEAMVELERDVHLHIHLENNILFPRSITLEARLLG